jgi:hypothetical protein
MIDRSRINDSFMETAPTDGTIKVTYDPASGKFQERVASPQFAPSYIPESEPIVGPDDAQVIHGEIVGREEVLDKSRSTRKFGKVILKVGLVVGLFAASDVGVTYLNTGKMPSIVQDATELPSDLHKTKAFIETTYNDVMGVFGWAQEMKKTMTNEGKK